MRPLPWILLLLTTPLIAAPPAGKERPPTPVEVVETTLQQPTERYTLYGKVVALQQSRLIAPVAARLEQLTPQEGERLSPGALIARFDTTAIESDIATTRGRLEQAEVNLKRQQQLAQSKIASEEQVLAARTEVTIQQQTLAALRHRLALHRVTAPFASQVTQRLQEPGSWISSGTPLLELIATESLVARLTLPLPYYSSYSRPTR